MAFAWLVIPILVLMAKSFGEGISQRSKRGVDTRKEPSFRHSFDQKELKKEDFDNRAIVFENHVDVEDLDNHFGGFQHLVQTQSWEIALVS